MSHYSSRVPFFIPAVLAVIAILAAAGGVALALKRWPSLLGKSVLVIGNTGSGKTTLVHFLLEGAIPAQTWKTANTTTHEPDHDIELGDLKLEVERIWDTAGDERITWEAWHQKAKEADVVLYLIHGGKATTADHSEIIRRDAQQIALWSREREARPEFAVVLVVTHCDTMPFFDQLEGHHRSVECLNWARSLAGTNAALEVLGPGTPLVAGSLRDETCAGELVINLFETLVAREV